jgi:hypothetical protein
VAGDVAGELVVAEGLEATGVRKTPVLLAMTVRVGQKIRQPPGPDIYYSKWL